MKRALATAVAICTLGVAAFGFGPITGSWTATIGLLPAPTTLASTFTLSFPVAGVTITSISDLTQVGLTGQRFTLAGAFGPFTLAGGMIFAVTPPAYTSSHLTTSFDFGGIALSLLVNHWAAGPVTVDGVTFGVTGAPLLRYTFTGTVAPVTVRARFLDESTGTEFQDLLVTMAGLPLCCGITYTVRFQFVKAGFDFVEFTGLNIPVFGALTFDLTVRYTVTAKVVTLTPRLPDIAACVSVWITPLVEPTNVFTGVRLDGLRIRCELGDCNFFEWTYAFDVTAMNAVLPAADDFIVAHAENQQARLRFCGPGCCGGVYTVDVRIFGRAPHDTLFGLSRFVFAATVPIMPALTASVGGTLPVFGGVTPALTIGWTFTF